MAFLHTDWQQLGSGNVTWAMKITELLEGAAFGTTERGGAAFGPGCPSALASRLGKTQNQKAPLQKCRCSVEGRCLCREPLMNALNSKVAYSWSGGARRDRSEACPLPLASERQQLFWQVNLCVDLNLNVLFQPSLPRTHLPCMKIHTDRLARTSTPRFLLPF